MLVKSVLVWVAMHDGCRFVMYTCCVVSETHSFGVRRLSGEHSLASEAVCVHAVSADATCFLILTTELHTKTNGQCLSSSIPFYRWSAHSSGGDTYSSCSGNCGCCDSCCYLLACQTARMV